MSAEYADFETVEETIKQMLASQGIRDTLKKNIV
jgi:hypothetical protein